MIPSDEQLIRTLTMLGCSREFATSALFRDRWAAIVIHEAVQRAREGDLRSACLVDGARTMFALLTGDLKASPASSCDFDDDAVAREREAVAARGKQQPSLPAADGGELEEAPLADQQDQQEQDEDGFHAQDDESGVDLARMLAGAIRSTLSSLPFQPPEAIGSLVSMKLRGALAEYERQVAASDQKREPS